MATKQTKPTPAQAAATLTDDVVTLGVDAFGIKSGDRAARVKAVIAARNGWSTGVSFSVIEYRARLVAAAPAGITIDSQASLYRAAQAAQAVAQLTLPPLTVAEGETPTREQKAADAAILATLAALDAGGSVKAVSEAVKATAGKVPAGPMHDAAALEAVGKLPVAAIDAAQVSLDAAAKAKAGTSEAKAKAAAREAEKLAADMRALTKRVQAIKTDDAEVRGAAAVLVAALTKAFPTPTAPTPTPRPRAKVSA